jgi:tight adherence protein F
MKKNSRCCCFWHKQGGSFAIELAFVLIALCAIYLFATDLSHKLLVRAKLDRSSFALVNILKERSRYFDADLSEGENLRVTEQDLASFEKIAGRLLNTPSDDVAIMIESLENQTIETPISSERYKALDCETPPIKDYKDLVPQEKGVVYPLYRVTLCEEHRSWFQPFVGSGSPMFKIVSSSVIVGR